MNIYVPQILPAHDVLRLSVGFSRRMMEDAEHAANAALQNLAEFDARIHAGDDFSDDRVQPTYEEEKVFADLLTKWERAEQRFQRATSKLGFDLAEANRFST